MIIGVDPDPASAPALRDWAVGYWEALHPYSAGGAYVNFMMDEGQERVKATYGGNYDRLAQGEGRPTTRRTSSASTRTSSRPRRTRKLMKRPAAAVVASVVIGLALAGQAAASELVGVNATAVQLAADGAGRALVTYKSGGSVHRVLASGAINALPPSESIPQVSFRIDHRGGSIRNSCVPVKLPLAWFVAACRAADGSFWALQAWQRLLPNSGARPNPAQAVRELRLSHWTGPTAVLTVRFGWSYRRFLQIYGLYRYQDGPIFGYKLRGGVPLDGYGRNIYVDALDSDLGKGWKRVNSFLAHAPLGGFCYGFFKHAGRFGVGPRLRATVEGPGVTPDVMWEASPPPQYSPEDDRAADADLAALLAGDPTCRPV